MIVGASCLFGITTSGQHTESALGESTGAGFELQDRGLSRQPASSPIMGHCVTVTTGHLLLEQTLLLLHLDSSN
jgi:hypothetical protein